MEFGRAFSYITEDAGWLKKVGIAALISLIPLIGQIMVLGWGMEITRRVINKDPEPLPTWDDFSGHLSRGFQAFVISFAYMLPVILISSCSNLALPLLDQSGDTSQALLTALGVVTACLGCFSAIYGLAVGVVLPAALGNFAATGELGAGFRFAEVFGLVRAATGPYLLVLLGSMISGFIASLGLILCIVGVYFTLAFAMAINAHLYGQAYSAAKAAQATAPAM
jgi:hypothetical protein